LFERRTKRASRSLTQVAMNGNPYLLDRDRQAALRRLQVVEQLEDPATIRRLEEIGVKPGWVCLEVGAGAGSIARWLDSRVSPGGHVVAADIEIDLLERLGAGNAEIRQLDLTRHSLEECAFDLVHARNLLIHLPDWEEILAKLVKSLRQGGWILLEEPDVMSDAADPNAPMAKRGLYEKGTAAVFDFLRSQGLDLHLGARLPTALRSLGLNHVHAEGIAPVFRGGDRRHRSPHASAFAEIRESILAEGGISASEFREFLALYEDPRFSWREGLRMMVSGRLPGVEKIRR
jgi:SAM-dependent methyltransferase